MDSDALRPAARLAGDLAYISLTHCAVIRRFGDTALSHRYWTGRTWSTVVRFAKQYTPTDAAAQIRQRFMRLDPLPKIVPIPIPKNKRGNRREG